jgi:hypothetical protein
VQQRPLGPDQGLDRALDQLLTGLGQDLDGDVLGDQVLGDELPDEVEVGLAGRGEADLDLLVAHADEQLEHAQLALGVHGVDQRLVAVAKVHRAPAGSSLDALGGPGPVGEVDRLEGLVFVYRHAGRLLGIDHRCSLLLAGCDRVQVGVPAR